MSLAWLWELLWTKACLDWSETHWWLGPYLQWACIYAHWVAIWGYDYINELIKPDFKIRQSKIALKETPILKLGVTLVLTESQVYVFVILHQETCMPSYHKSFLLTMAKTIKAYFTFSPHPTPSPQPVAPQPHCNSDWKGLSCALTQRSLSKQGAPKGLK